MFINLIFINLFWSFFCYFKFRDDLKEELDVAEFKHGYILQRIECLKKNESQNYELTVKLTELDENEKVIKKLRNQSKRSTIYGNLCYPFIMIFLLLLNVSFKYFKNLKMINYFNYQLFKDIWSISCC